MMINERNISIRIRKYEFKTFSNSIWRYYYEIHTQIQKSQLKVEIE